MSFGTPTYSKALESKIQEAADHGILLIAAAGNNGTEKNSVEYPAAYDEVIAVGSINATMERANHSARGEQIELMAPGENVPIESLLGATTIGSGTSYAAPHVTAVAALLWQEEPEIGTPAHEKFACVKWAGAACWIFKENPTQYREAGKIRALLQAGTRKLTEENSGYGLIDYSYTKSIQSDFDTTYERKDKESTVRTYNNEEELEEYEMPKVVANWQSGGHETLINNSLGNKTEAWQKGYTAKEIKVLQRVNCVQDTGTYAKGKEKDKPLLRLHELHAGKDTNYVAVTAYLYHFAMKQKEDPTKSLEQIKKELKNYGAGMWLTLDQMDEIQYAIKAICDKKGKGENDQDASKDEKEWIPNVSYSSNSAGKNRALRILGMAMHVAGDAYAHKAMVFETEWNEKKKTVQKYFDTAQLKEVDKKAKAETLTTAGIAAEIKNNNTNQHKCHGETADDSGFLRDRYRYGAQHAVTALMRGYYNKTMKCSSSVFYGGGKNKVPQYRLWTHIKDVYPNENEAKWREISREDISKLRPAN